MPETTNLKTNCSPTWVSSVTEDKSKTLFASFIIILSQVYRGVFQRLPADLRTLCENQQTYLTADIEEICNKRNYTSLSTIVCVRGVCGGGGSIIHNILLTYNGFIVFQ